MRRKFAAYSCITEKHIKVNKISIKPPSSCNKKKEKKKNTNTINASSIVPASIPTIPTVQFRGRTLKTQNDTNQIILNCQMHKCREAIFQ